jgi:hypothetical protein
LFAVATIGLYFGDKFTTTKLLLHGDDVVAPRNTLFCDTVPIPATVVAECNQICESYLKLCDELSNDEMHYACEWEKQRNPDRSSDQFKLTDTRDDPEENEVHYIGVRTRCIVYNDSDAYFRK